MAKDYTLEKRKLVIGGAAIVVILIFLIRLFVLQLLTDDYKKNADSNAFLNKIQYPARGAIYDRNGKLLVFNQPAYDITMVPKEVENLDTLDLCRALNITRDQFLKIISDMTDRRRNPGYSKYTNQLFMSQLSAEECGVFQEKLFKFSGFYIQRRTIRQYSYNAAAHTLGDIGEVSIKDIESDEYYIRGDYIGKLGVEKSYEKQLRGEKGVEILLRDAHGRIQGNYMDGKLDKRPVPGKNLTLSLDIDLQLLGERLMKDKIGSIVAIEPETGEILCMVSSPTFDPHLMIGRQRGKNHLMLQRDIQKPLLNRALMGAYPPGSTFKAAQALTFLQEGIIQENTPAYPCSHGFSYGSLRVGCHAHASPLPLVPALATSCNSYFCWGLFRMFGDRKYGSPQNAITVWKDHMVSQGFGYRLGVDLPSEGRGLIPNAQFYDKAYRGRWNGLTVISIAIGQGEILATPLQIANLAATIANRGHFITPHIVKKIENEPLDSLYRFPQQTTIDPIHYEEVVKGMRAAVTGGTCRLANIPDIEVCGKTGTAQNRGHDHSSFMGFAPMNKPKIAVLVYVENGGWGATFGVPYGALIMEQYLNGKLSPESEARAEELCNKVISYGYQER
ncbi:penicillin-binding protein 2 [Bacteroides sp.]|uniref:penicillin-binding protein 2 n=1 Tax=Bacteroides sp. TaxID=29523 RepID=UPI001B3DC155|nr:penicillin-binding protein 2 [Bacteroides sp.]MBP6065976.1 penicillin-binding protein 2 [Bacteroides sp.]MBP6067993.1 penicillin-binding protein 2 [Bacteroides sp.]MBP6937112.1 penicillin-binding protein 2 [Bacteroides sp.]MBP8622498.1 penicillin-binding protein 2 [Bacteroides sp.]MBP9506539.1 penicillin-binding protein 2 [Bacteroides sp.]